MAFDCVLLLRRIYPAETGMVLMTAHGLGAFITAVEAFEEDTRAGNADAQLHATVLDTLADIAQSNPKPLQVGTLNPN